MFFKDDKSKQTQSVNRWVRYPQSGWHSSKSIGIYKMLGAYNDRQVSFKWTLKQSDDCKYPPFIEASKNTSHKEYWESLSLSNCDLAPYVELLHSQKFISDETYSSFINHPDDGTYLTKIKDKNISFSGNDKRCGNIIIEAHQHEILRAFEIANLIPNGFSDEYELFCKEVAIENDTKSSMVQKL